MGTQAAALGLGAAGLLGAAALGAAAIAARASSSGGGSSSRQTSQRGGGHGRYSRDVGQEGDQIDLVFKAIAEMDVSHCAKRYLCEISATPVDQLSAQDINTLVLFEAPTSSVNSYKRLFDEAARLGSSSRNILNCQTRYPTCDIQEGGLAEILNSQKLVVTNHL